MHLEEYNKNFAGNNIMVTSFVMPLNLVENYHFLDRGDLLFRQGQAADSVYYLTSGVIALTYRGENSGRIIADWITQGSIFGMSSGMRHNGGAEALSASKCVSYSREHFENEIVRNPKLCEKLNNDLVCIAERQQVHAYQIGRMDSVSAVAQFLLDLIYRQNGSFREREMLDIPMNRRDIADYLGLTFETVSRSFSVLKKNNIINFSKAREVNIRSISALEHLSKG